MLYTWLNPQIRSPAYMFDNNDDTFKILFTSYDAPKCIQAMSTMFFLFLVFHVEHECHYDRFELEKKYPISRLSLTSPESQLQVRYLDHQPRAGKPGNCIQYGIRHRGDDFQVDAHRNGGNRGGHRAHVHRTRGLQEFPVFRVSLHVV